MLRIWPWRRYTKRMELDPTKVQKLLNQLNKGKNGPWVPLDGYRALTVLEFQSDKSATFNPSEGIPLKVFINVKTGEIKIYHVNFLRPDNVG